MVLREVLFLMGLVGLQGGCRRQVKYVHAGRQEKGLGKSVRVGRGRGGGAFVFGDPFES